MSMRESKSFASLSSGLLARKGAAKPAMRPQGFGGFGSSLEDLGWNDMGQDDEPEPAPRPMAALTPSPTRHAPEPAVVQQQRFLHESFVAPEPVTPEAVALELVAPEPVAPEPQAALPASTLNLPRRRGAVKTGTAKAAFTLRLDPERHLKLRFACAITRQSAQQLVTGALDQYLNSLPELEALAHCLPAEPGKRSR
jgi:hypothetical protein